MSDIWRDMIMPGVPWIEKIVRPLIVYVFLVVAIRLASKRLLAQFTTFDLVVLLILSNTVQNAIIGNDNSLLGGIVAAVALLVLNAVVVRLVYRHKPLEDVLEGCEEPLIEGGKIQVGAMRENRITEQELQSAIQKQGFRSLADVDSVHLLPGGQLTVQGRSPSRIESYHEETLIAIRQLGQELRDLRAVVEGRGSR